VAQGQPGKLAGAHVAALRREQLAEQLEAALNGGQRRAQLMAGQRQELILEVAMQTGCGDVTNDDDAVFLMVTVEWLPVRFEPAADALPRRQVELHAERLAPCSPSVRRRIGWQWLPLRILRDKGCVRAAEHVRVGR